MMQLRNGNRITFIVLIQIVINGLFFYQFSHINSQISMGMEWIAVSLFPYLLCMIGKVRQDYGISYLVFAAFLPIGALIYRSICLVVFLLILGFVMYRGTEKYDKERIFNPAMLLFLEHLWVILFFFFQGRSAESLTLFCCNQLCVFFSQNQVYQSDELRATPRVRILGLIMEAAICAFVSYIVTPQTFGNGLILYIDRVSVFVIIVIAEVIWNPMFSLVRKQTENEN